MRSKLGWCMALLLLIAFSYSIVNLNFNYNKLYKHEKNAFKLAEHKTNLQALLKCNNRLLETEIVQYGNYWVVLNFIRGIISTNVSCAETITYTTHGDYKYLRQLPTLVERWRAPISIALYTPGKDLSTTLHGIEYLYKCDVSRALIRKYVTVHIYFPYTHMPADVPQNASAFLDVPADYDCNRQYFKQLKRVQLYRHKHKLRYPINVGRNLARKAANTYFILASDVELFPSPGLVQQFLALLASRPSAIIGGKRKRVFPLPVFEVQKDASLPATKTELVKMLYAQRAIPFHSHICSKCHLVPKYLAWLNASDTQTLSVFVQTKREMEFVYWEPFYISDNREPPFDERVKWEGRSDKRIQNYAMCLLDYEYHVLHPAFLVHAPGIKFKTEPNVPSKKLDFVAYTNTMIKNVIQPEYRILYGDNPLCDV